ncbi:MAG: glycosyltransferase, partial [Halobacteriaceae archaeon]
QHELTDYSTIVTSGNEPLWYVPEDHQTVVAYTHSPPRWQYDLFHDHSGLLHVVYNYATRVLYQHNITRPDLWVANSDRVARRIRQYWNIPKRQIRVVYPPVPVTNYGLTDATTKDFYLYLGRLARHKRVDGLIETFNNRPEQLKIAGKGPDKSRLEAMATDNIEFLGYVSEERKYELMAAAKCHCYPALNEDFGMVPIESMAAGTPVIGINEGFTQYQIMNGKNGYTFERGHLNRAIEYFETHGVEWSSDRIAQFADRFDVQQFEHGIQQAVEVAQERTDINPDWYELVDQPDQRIPAVADGGDADEK